jgi:hypothetical protein
MSAFYLVAYASISVPAIVAGVLATPLGLNATFEIFGSVVAGVALIVAALAWRTRPSAPAGTTANVAAVAPIRPGPGLRTLTPRLREAPSCTSAQPADVIS